jgi:hypothetical protein
MAKREIKIRKKIKMKMKIETNNETNAELKTEANLENSEAEIFSLKAPSFITAGSQ